MHRLMIAGLALGLGGCNMVVSDKPWFAASEAAQPGLKDGLWVNLKGPDCQFDPALAVQDWPECAQPMLVDGAFYRGPNGKADEDKAQLADVAKWDKIEHVLVAGDPLIDQIDMKSGADDPTRSDSKGYLYIAARIVKRDADGRAIEVQRWPVACGPMPKQLPKRKGMPIPSDFVTKAPFPGLKVKDSACTAADIAALRRAAALSEKIAVPNKTPPITSRWVRAKADGGQAISAQPNN